MSEPEETLLQASRFRVVEISRTLADGTVWQREVIRHPGAVTILPMVDNDHVCLIKNLRPAVDKTLIELPAGTLEPDEPHQTTAARELIEETGYRAGHLEDLHEFYLSPGILDECMHLYVAKDLSPGDPDRESGEEIENLVVSWNEAMELIDSREIRDAKTIVGLMFYDRLRQATG